jgi:hypothetical protein
MPIRSLKPVPWNGESLRKFGSPFDCSNSSSSAVSLWSAISASLTTGCSLGSASVSISSGGTSGGGSSKVRSGGASREAWKAGGLAGAVSPPKKGHRIRNSSRWAPAEIASQGALLIHS